MGACGFFLVVDEGDVGDVLVAAEGGCCCDFVGSEGCAGDGCDVAASCGCDGVVVAVVVGGVEDEGYLLFVELSAEDDAAEGGPAVAWVVAEVDGACDEEACGAVGEGGLGEVVEVLVVVGEDEVVGGDGPFGGAWYEVEAEVLSPEGDEACSGEGGDELVAGGVVGEGG